MDPIIALSFLIMVLAGLLVLALLRRPGPSVDLINQAQRDAAILTEKVSQLERGQAQTQQSVAAIQNSLTETGTQTQGLVGAATALRDQLQRAQESLAALQKQAEAQHRTEQQSADSIRRLEAVIAGTQTKGEAGENILEVMFAKFPPDWQVRNLRVGDKFVEFGLRMPNGLVLPIDSKWPATNLVEQFFAANDDAERQRIKQQIEGAVLTRAREVRKYLDPNITVNLGLAVVPDAVYELCTGLHAEAFQMNVSLVSYSMFMPYLLLVFQSIGRTSQTVDLQKLHNYLEGAQNGVKALQDEIDGRFSRAITMLTNARSDMAAQLSKLGGGFLSIQTTTAPLPVSTALPPATIPGDEGDGR